MGLLRNLLAAREFSYSYSSTGTAPGLAAMSIYRDRENPMGLSKYGYELPEERLWSQITDDPD